MSHHRVAIVTAMSTTEKGAQTSEDEVSKGKRIDFSQYEVAFKEAGLSGDTVERARVAITAFNAALDLLEYDGEELPKVVFTRSVPSPGGEQVANFAPRGFGEDPTPVVQICYGSNVDIKMYPAEIVAGVTKNTARDVFSLVETMLLNAHFYVNRDKIPLPQKKQWSFRKLFAGNQAPPPKLPFKVAAEKFAEENVLKVVGQFADAIKYFN